MTYYRASVLTVWAQILVGIACSLAEILVRTRAEDFVWHRYNYIILQLDQVQYKDEMTDSVKTKREFHCILSKLYENKTRNVACHPPLLTLSMRWEVRDRVELSLAPSQIRRFTAVKKPSNPLRKSPNSNVSYVPDTSHCTGQISKGLHFNSGIIQRIFRLGNLMHNAILIR